MVFPISSKRFGVMREDGPETLIAATARLTGFRIGAETQRMPSSISSSSIA